ncbi:hypothetical protein CLAIMM_12352 [Cladophialophora immunda]|nr:hypothetical protein CLAIMM_12352 [Cladophialophora immunda]
MNNGVLKLEEREKEGGEEERSRRIPNHPPRQNQKPTVISALLSRKPLARDSGSSSRINAQRRAKCSTPVSLTTSISCVLCSSRRKPPERQHTLNANANNTTAMDTVIRLFVSDGWNTITINGTTSAHPPNIPMIKRAVESTNGE